MIRRSIVGRVGQALRRVRCMSNNRTPKPQLFLESADRNDWDALLPLGIFSGIVTTPELLKAANVTIQDERMLQVRQLVRDAVQEYKVGQIRVPAWGATPEKIVEAGTRIAMFDKAAIVGVPCTPEGTSAAAQLVHKNAQVVMTAVHSEKQALVAAALGAQQIAPCLTSMQDAGDDALARCQEMQRVLQGLSSETQLAPAAAQTPQQLIELAQMGITSFSITPALAYQLVHQPLTMKQGDMLEETMVEISQSG